MTAEVFGARRDASWYDKPGYGSKYHVVVGRDGTGAAVLAACSPDHPGLRRARMILAEFTERAARDIPAYMRCQRPGCRQRWPDDHSARRGQ